MPANVSKQRVDAHRVIAEIEPPMQKANLRKAETAQEHDDLGSEIGACLDAARRELRWTLDELAGKLPPPKDAEKRDPRQVQRWIDGKERVQMDVVFKVPELREPFVIELARLAQCEVETTVTIRRRR